MKNIIKRHSRMVDDLRRTGPLLAAIRATIQKGDIVLDIGTGLGLLAIEAAKSGAKKVYAMDCDCRALKVAKKNAQKAGVSDKIEFIEGLSFDSTLPGKADVLLCETVGSFAFDENILSTIADAKGRLIKKDARIIPLEIFLYGAPASVLPKVDPVSEIALINKKSLCGPPVLLFKVDFLKKVPVSVHVKATFKCGNKTGFPLTARGNDRVIKCVAVWPKINWAKGFTTDASPFSKPTHWKQGILPLETKPVCEGNNVTFEFIVKPHPKDERRWTERLWRLG